MQTVIIVNKETSQVGNVWEVAKLTFQEIQINTRSTEFNYRCVFHSTLLSVLFLFHVINP